MVSKGVHHPQKYSGRKRKHKREDNFNSFQDSARHKEAQGKKKLKEMDQTVESVDLISQLPDHVIHHILSLVRNVKYAIRTSVLSKKWRALWCTFSVLVFDERRFAAGIAHGDSTDMEKMFRDYVSDSMQVHVEKNAYIQKLVLHMTSSGLVAAPHMDHWLSVAIAKNIKELDLHLEYNNSGRYTVPQTVFSSKTLTGLRLSGCKLDNCTNVMVPHLQKLYLRNLHLLEHTVQNLISSCHSIEDLRIIHCSGLKHLQVSNHFRLNRVEIYHCNQLRKVELRLPNLQTFWYCGKRATLCKVSLEGCKSLKRLTLEHPQVTRDFCNNQFSNFPLLEKLDITVSNKMKCISISNPQLQRLVLKGCKKLDDIVLDAPKLLSLEYRGENMPLIEFRPFSLIEAKLSFELKPNPKDLVYLKQLRKCLKSFVEKFDPEGFKLILHSNKHIIIHEDLNHFHIPPFPYYGLEIIKSSACIQDILHGLVRTLHPVSLTIISPLDSKSPKLVYEMLKNSDHDSICCKYSTLNNKCWRHFLKDVEIDLLSWIDDFDIKSDEDVNIFAWSQGLQSANASLHCQMDNLRLKWEL